MCNFFSFKTDGDHNLYYFSAQQRREVVCYPDGQKIDSYDSHTSIESFYHLDDTKWLSGEYNPFTDELALDTPGAAWDEHKVRNMLAGVDWRSLCGDLEGARAFLTDLKTIPWFKPDGMVVDGQSIKVFKTRSAARDAARDADWDADWYAARSAAWDAAWDAARSSAWDAAWDAARDAAWDAARDAAWDAARSSAWDAAWDAARDADWYADWYDARSSAWDAAWDAARDAALFVRVIHVCNDLQVEQKHIDHVKQRMDIWRHGYGVYCDVNGVLYCYEGG